MFSPLYQSGAQGCVGRGAGTDTVCHGTRKGLRLKAGGRGAAQPNARLHT